MLSNRFRVAVFLLSGALAATALAAQEPRESRPASRVLLRASYFDAATRIAAPDEVRLKTLPPTADFDVTLIGFPPDARAAFEHAIDLWSRMISSPVPIVVQAQWLPLDPGVLGGAGASYVHRDFAGAGVPGSWYVDALADRLAGLDLSPGSPDIFAGFNSAFGGTWYFGTDGNPPAGTFDLVTVVLHEIGHGLGMSGSMAIDDVTGLAVWGLGTAFPVIYDRFAVDGQGNSLIDQGVYLNPSAELRDALESGAVFFDGPLANLKNGGSPAPLFAPPFFLPGSSYGHLDEAAFPAGHPASLMTPFLAMSEAIHDPGELLLCLFEDLGWETAASCATGPPCVPSETTLCLNDDRFRVELEWARPAAELAPARVKALDADDSGLFYFANPNNLEMLVKVLDNCSGPSNRFWVFAAATTTLEFNLEVTDTETGVVRTYRNPPGMPATPITDTQAFATCP